MGSASRVTPAYDKVKELVAAELKNRLDDMSDGDEDEARMALDLAIPEVTEHLDAKRLAEIILERPELAEMEVELGYPGATAAYVMREALEMALQKDTKELVRDAVASIGAAPRR